MEEKELLDQIAEKEWKMFRVVNGEDHVACQEDEGTFKAMRKAQFSAWSKEAAESYLQDLEEAEAQGRNLIREKYIRMMESTQPEGYKAFCGELPQLSAEQEALTAELWQHFKAQTERMRETYPALALGGRPLLASEETNGWASIETYQTGELKTYSERTLRALLAHMEALAGGIGELHQGVEFGLVAVVLAVEGLLVQPLLLPLGLNGGKIVLQISHAFFESVTSAPGRMQSVILYLKNAPISRGWEKRGGQGSGRKEADRACHTHGLRPQPDLPPRGDLSGLGTQARLRSKP